MHSISTKFELNLAGTGVEINSATTFAVKNRIPTIVVNPDLCMNAMVDRQTRMKMQPPYKIIVAIDFEKNGINYIIMAHVYG